jgi:hypothetical protein
MSASQKANPHPNPLPKGEGMVLGFVPARLFRQRHSFTANSFSAPLALLV